VWPRQKFKWLRESRERPVVIVQVERVACENAECVAYVGER
jgi:hypothetical protein